MARATAKLTNHARLRCQQMGVATKRVKRVLRNPTLIYPSPPNHGEGVVVTSDIDDELAVCCTSDLGVVFTVLWKGEFTRDKA